MFLTTNHNALQNISYKQNLISMHLLYKLSISHKMIIYKPEKRHPKGCLKLVKLFFAFPAIAFNYKHQDCGERDYC